MLTVSGLGTILADVTFLIAIAADEDTLIGAIILVVTLLATVMAFTTTSTAALRAITREMTDCVQVRIRCFG